MADCAFKLYSTIETFHLQLTRAYYLLGIIGYNILTQFSYNAILEITVSHFPNNNNILSTKIHFGLPNFLYILMEWQLIT